MAVDLFDLADGKNVGAMFKRFAERDKRSSALEVQESVAKKVEGMADNILRNEEQISSYQDKGLEGIKKFYEKQVKKGTRDAERAGVKILRETKKWESAMEAAEKAIERDQKAIMTEITRYHESQMRTAVKEVEKILKTNQKQKISTVIHINGVPCDVNKVDRDDLLSHVRERMEKRFEDASENVTRHVEESLEKYSDAKARIVDITKDIETATKKTAEELLGKAGLTKATEEAFSKFEDVAAKAESKPKFVMGAVGGGVAGAVVGNMMSSEETKGQNTVIGGIVGAVLGGVAQYWSSAKSALGATLHGRDAMKIAEQAISHSRF